MRIRSADAADQKAIYELNHSAFDESERELVATLASDLLADDSTPETLNLVAEEAGRILGHVSFSPLYSRSSSKASGYLLAPLAVLPSKQKTGIGSSLVREGLKQLGQWGVDLVIVYGDPAYYGRFGFDESAAKDYAPPFPLKYPFGWLALRLCERQREIEPFEVVCVPALNKPELW